MIGDKLKHLRNKNKLTQVQLAEKLGITRGTYAHYEINKRHPDYDTIHKMADFFGVSTDYLLGRTDDPGSVASSMNQQNDTEILDTFSKRLQKHRLEKGLSYDDLAEKVGLVPATIEKLEKNPSSVPGQKTLDRLSSALDVTRDYLLGYTDDAKGFGRGTYDTDSKDIKKLMDQAGPVMYDGIVIEDEEAKEKLDLLIRQAVFMITEENKKDAAKRKKKKD